MFTILGAARMWRPAFLLLVGAVLGATILAPVVARDNGPDAGSGTTATTYTRSASCAGLNFYPVDQSSADQVGTLRVRTSTSGDGYFLCNPGLPNGAVVTKVEFTLLDTANDGDVSHCALVRSGLTPSAAAVAEVMALVPGTGVGATPGTVRPFDDTIASATINNAQFGYWLQCQIADPTAYFHSLGIYGADVIYKITAAKG